MYHMQQAIERLSKAVAFYFPDYSLDETESHPFFEGEDGKLIQFALDNGVIVDWNTHNREEFLEHSIDCSTVILKNDKGEYKTTRSFANVLSRLSSPFRLYTTTKEDLIVYTKLKIQQFNKMTKTRDYIYNLNTFGFKNMAVNIHHLYLCLRGLSPLEYSVTDKTSINHTSFTKRIVTQFMTVDDEWC